MGTKISQLTETGSAPTGAMVPIEYEDANYRVNAGDFNNKGSGKYVSSWQLASDTDTFTVTHNLGTPDVIVRVFVNTSASDTNAQSIEGVNESTQGHGSAIGYSVTNITSTSCTVQLGYGYWDISTAGTLVGTNFSSGGTAHYVKFVVLAAGTGERAQKFADSAAQSENTTVDYKIGDLQGQDQVFISASIRHSLVTDPWQISATYGRSDASATRVLTATVFGRAAAPGETQSYTVLEGGPAVSFWGGLGVNHTMKFKAVGDEVFVELFCPVSYPATIYWSYTASAGAGGGSGTKKYVADWATSHGGTTVDDEATLGISHDLGTADFNVTYYVNDAATDTNAQIVTWDAYPSVSAGAQTTDVSTTGVTTQLGKNGYVHATSAGQTDFSGWAGKYLKAVFIG